MLQGKPYLIISDRYSKFVIVYALIDHNAEQTIKVFCNIFCKHDIPKILITDHGRNYTSSAFTAFCCELDINHVLTSSYHHQSYPAEHAIRTAKGIICKCMQTGNSWHLGLLEYLCTPISDNIPSPSELLNHRYRGVQPFLNFNAKASTASFLPQEKFQDEQQKHQSLNEFHSNKSSVKHCKESTERSNVLVHITDQKPKHWCKGIVLHCKDKTYNIKLQSGKSSIAIELMYGSLGCCSAPNLPCPYLSQCLIQ